MTALVESGRLGRWSGSSERAGNAVWAFARKQVVVGRDHPDAGGAGSKLIASAGRPVQPSHGFFCPSRISTLRLYECECGQRMWDHRCAVL